MCYWSTLLKTESNIYLSIYVYDCSDVMHCRITSGFSRSDGLADFHLAKVHEKSVVDINNLVRPGIVASTPDHCSILSRNMDVAVPQSSLYHTMHRITLHLCVTCEEISVSQASAS